jgi:NADPH:quinone reductase-like Zn-dependent oxidoreductase
VPESLLSTRRLTIAGRSRDLPRFQGLAPFTVARRCSNSASDADALLLVPGDGQVDAEVDIENRHTLRLSPTMTVAQALLIPPLAAVLALWETLQLELGDVAVITAGSVLSPLAAEVALWRGACPVVTLGPAAVSDGAAATAIDWSDPEEASRHLLAAVGDRPGFAALELSGRAEMIDLLFESIPRWGRLLLAGSAGQPITVDFYKNIHRKGVTVNTAVLEPAALFDAKGGAAARAQVTHATAILEIDSRLRRCVSLLGAEHRQFAPVQPLRD